MKRSRKSREMDERFARFDAEDRAVAYLAKFPPPVARAIALYVEWSLATKCAAEQSEMWRRRDPSKVFPIALDDFQKLIAALAEIPSGVHSDTAAEQHTIDLLADFPPDQAWFVAHKIAKWAEFYALMKRPELDASLNTS
jgi:hypothetical protein